MPAEPITMQCMEVWGGSELVQSKTSLAGLDVWVFSKPYQSAAAGGDVYYVSSCATGRVTRLLIADVSGHGNGVRDTAIALRTLMRKYVNHLDQSAFVKSMNHHFTQMSVDGKFATAVVMTFFGPHRSLSISNAGHPPPLWFHSRRGEWQYLERHREKPLPRGQKPALSNLPLGIDELVDYDQTSLNLDVGDLVICFSDSLIEARTIDGDQLGQEGLLRIARTLDPRDPDAVIQQLLDAILHNAPHALDEDDVTVMLFRATGGGERMPIRERLRAPLRIVRGVVNACFRGGPLPIPQISLLNIGGAVLHRFNRPKER